MGVTLRAGWVGRIVFFVVANAATVASADTNAVTLDDSQDLPWTRILIDDEFAYTDGAHNILPYDLNGDGRYELVANAYKADSLQFYQYNGNPTDPSSWTRYVIDDNISPGNDNSAAHYTAIVDINGDGRVDLISAENTEEEDVVAYLAPVDITDTAAWERRVLYNSGHPSWGAYHIDAGDIDGNNTSDIAVLMRWGNRVGWLNNDGSEDDWAVTWVDTSIGEPFNVKIADFNKDGQNDMIASSIDDNQVYLYTYSGDPQNAANWSRASLGHFSYDPITMHVADLDQDGDLDILLNDHQYHEMEDDFLLLENPYPNTVETQWNQYMLGHYDAREIDVGDVDNDGDQDIVLVEQNECAVIWLENDGTTLRENWTAHTIDVAYDGYLDWAHGMGIADIDRNGFLDVAVAAARGDSFHLYFQSDLEGDLNGDGFVGGDDLDIVRSFWGQTATDGDPLSGDLSGDGFVGGDDLDIIRANWGRRILLSPFHVVPEPKTIVLLFLGALCFRLKRRASASGRAA